MLHLTQCQVKPVYGKIYFLHAYQMEYKGAFDNIYLLIYIFACLIEQWYQGFK